MPAELVESVTLKGVKFKNPSKIMRVINKDRKVLLPEPKSYDIDYDSDDYDLTEVIRKR